MVRIVGRVTANRQPHALKKTPSTRPLSTLAFGIAYLALAVGFAAPVRGQIGLRGGNNERETAGGSTSTTARLEVMRSVPWDQMAPEARAKALNCLSDHTVYRRLPVCMIQCDAHMYSFLVNHPDVVVNIWETLGITQLSIRETPTGSYQMVDEAGTVGTVEYLYRSPKKLIIYTSGRYEGPLFGSEIRGRSVVVLTSQYQQAPDGRHYVTCQADCFVKIDNTGAELIARLFQPLVGRVVDNNFVQTASFFSDFSRTAEVNPEGIARLSQQLTNVRPEIRERLAHVAAYTAHRAEFLAQQRVESRSPAGIFAPTSVPSDSTAALPASGTVPRRENTIGAPGPYPEPQAIAEANASYYGATPGHWTDHRPSPAMHTTADPSPFPTHTRVAYPAMPMPDEAAHSMSTPPTLYFVQ